MLKRTLNEIDQIEKNYPGIKESILHFENADLPTCTCCGSVDTADVQIGVIGRTMAICASTTKFHLILNGPRPGRFFCNSCCKYFTPPEP